MRISEQEALELSKELSKDVANRAIRNIREGLKHRPCSCRWVEAGTNIKDPETEEQEEISLGYWRYRSVW